MMENIESLISDFKALKQEKKSMTIDNFVAKQPPDVAEELSLRLYFDMFEAWLNKTTQRRTSDWMRKKGAQRGGGAVKIESIDDTNGDDNPFMKILRSSDDGPVASLLYQEIISAFDGLDDPQKQICFLYYVDGYNDREISGKLRMKENTVTVYRHRGNRKLREILRRMEYHE